METAAALGSIPAFFALEVRAVRSGLKRAGSVQLDRTYFDGQQVALRALDSTAAGARIDSLGRSRRQFEAVTLSVESPTRRALQSASERLRKQFQALPEIDFLQDHVPGRCFVVPEWSRTGSRLRYGARVYVFRDEDAADPAEIVRENVAAVVDDGTARFDSFRGRLHGYPPCCVDAYSDRTDASRSPERRLLQWFGGLVSDDIRSDRRDPATSVRALVPSLFGSDDAYSFFTREFFPEPGCVAARRSGRAVYDELTDGAAEPLVRDHFRLNAGFTYLMARAAVTRASSRPPPGFLGREHRCFYLPLSALETLYRTDQL